MIKLGVFADLQYADQNRTEKRDYRASLEKFIKMAGFFSEQKLSLILQLGDAMNGGFENLTKVAELFRVSHLPIKSVLGNHDFQVERSQKKEVKRLLGLPAKGFYSLKLRDSENADNRWRIVILNGMEISTFAAENDEEMKQARKIQEKYRIGGPKGKLPYDWNGALSKSQLQWLDSVLTKAESQKEKVIVCSHFPLYSEAQNVNKIPKIGLLKNLGIYFFTLGVSTWNGQELLDLIDRHSCVKAYFAGHYHDGGFGTRKNVHHITFRGLVEVPSAHAIVTLEENLITVKGYGAEPDRTLKIS